MIAGLLGMYVSDAALALPEMQVGSRLVQGSASADTPVLSSDGLTANGDDAAAAEDDAQATAD